MSMLWDSSFDKMVLVRKALPYYMRGVDVLKDLNYSNNIYALRKERNVSQNKMAEATGISRRTISMIENGEQNVSLDYAYRISAYFNLLVQEVFPVMTNEESRDKK